MTQHDRLLKLLRSYNGNWCPLPKILDLHIAQYNRVVNDLRNGKHDGIFYNIENKLLEVINGERHTAFRLLENEPARTEQEEVIAETNRHAEEKINMAIFEKNKQFSFIGG